MLRSKEKQLQKANDALMDTLDVMIKVLKKTQGEIEDADNLLEQAEMHSTLYCKFVESRFDVDASEIANDFDQWISQFDEHDLRILGKEQEEIADSKIDAEVPGNLYTLDEIMNELEPPEEGSSK